MVKSRRYEFSFRGRSRYGGHYGGVDDCARLQKSYNIDVVSVSRSKKRTQDASDDSRYIRGQEKPQQKNMEKRVERKKEETGNHNKRRRKKKLEAAMSTKKEQSI